MTDLDKKNWLDVVAFFFLRFFVFRIIIIEIVLRKFFGHFFLGGGGSECGWGEELFQKLYLWLDCIQIWHDGSHDVYLLKKIIKSDCISSFYKYFLKGKYFYICGTDIR